MMTTMIVQITTKSGNVIRTADVTGVAKHLITPDAAPGKSYSETVLMKQDGYKSKRRKVHGKKFKVRNAKSAPVPAKKKQKEGKTK